MPVPRAVCGWYTGVSAQESTGSSRQGIAGEEVKFVCVPVPAEGAGLAVRFLQATSW